MKSMRDRMADSVWEHRLWGAMFGVFAALALGLAGIGLFGVMSHAVAQRTREIGIRMALGARPGNVGRMIVGEAMLLVGAGATVGIVAALAVGFVIRNLLFGVGPFDLTVYLVVTFVLAVVAALAAIVPARRAYRVDPIIALRSD
jgi:ABC-type antimicrobial peptide transport system permease subunit